MMASIVFALLGAGAGAAQSGLLSWSVGRPGSLGATILRFVLVAGVLLVAAISGELPAAAAGWFAGFLVASPIAARRLR